MPKKMNEYEIIVNFDRCMGIILVFSIIRNTQRKCLLPTGISLRQPTSATDKLAHVAALTVLDKGGLPHA